MNDFVLRSTGPMRPPRTRPLLPVFIKASFIAVALMTAGFVQPNQGQTAEPALPRRTGKPVIVASTVRSETSDGRKPSTDSSAPDLKTKRRSKASNVAVQQVAQSREDDSQPRSGADLPSTTFSARPELVALQSLETSPIDMAGAFALIGIRNPEFLAAQQRVLEATAARQLAAVQLLPTINLGTSVDSHQGPLQQSNGNILNVRRDSLFVGAGASAIAAGTINIPGVVWNVNVSETVYNFLISRQVQAQREARVGTVNNDVQLRLALAYLELVRAAGRRSICLQAREDLAEVVKMTSDFARVGQGREADADRAATEMRQRDADVIDAEAMMVRASAQVAAIVGLDTAVRLVPSDQWVVPHSIVPEPIPLPELLAIAFLQRPELAEQQADIARTLLAMDAAQMLPFSPNVFVGFSTGAFGGGSNLASEPVGSNPFARGQERFGNFQSRADFDVILYWTVKNLGVGNQAQIEASESRARQSQLQQLMVMDLIRAEVAAASYRVQARFHQIKTAESAVVQADTGWREDRRRMWANEGLPIEVLDSQRLLFRSRLALLNTILNYNRAQFELYQSMGNPQSELLIRTSNEFPEIEGLPAAPVER